MKKITETRRMSGFDLRSLCIRNNWFTCGDCEAYDKFLNLSGNNEKNITTADIYEMAQVVERYSSRDALAEMEITDIMFYLAEICTTTFEIEK